MKTALLTGIIATSTLLGFSQQEDKAKQILNELSQKTKTYKTISMSFKMSTKGQDINQTNTGTAKIKGDSYFLSVEGQDVYSDGKKQWTYLKEDNECYIEDVASAGEDFITPTKLLTIWEDGYKFQFEKEDATTQTIKLFPLNPAKSQFHTITLNIDKTKKEIKSAIIKAKSGVTVTYIVTKFETNIEIADNTFKFDKSKFPGVVIIED